MTVLKIMVVSTVTIMIQLAGPLSSGLVGRQQHRIPSRFRYKKNSLIRCYLWISWSSHCFSMIVNVETSILKMQSILMARIGCLTM